MAKTYEIAHIRDLLGIPVDRRQACLNEILPKLEMLVSAIPDAEFNVIRWTDDGEPHCKVKIIVGSE